MRKYLRWVKPNETITFRAWVHWRCFIKPRVWFNRWFGFEFESYEGEFKKSKNDYLKIMIEEQVKAEREDISVDIFIDLNRMIAQLRHKNKDDSIAQEWIDTFHDCVRVAHKNAIVLIDKKAMIKEME